MSLTDKYSDFKELRAAFAEKYKDKEVKQENISIKTNNTNVVSGETLRRIQSDTLKDTAKYLSKTFGPMGSNTKIITGANMTDINTAYSKDGLKVLKHIMNSGPIEMSIIEELVEITRSVEKEVGDGTTSTVILASMIFENLLKIQNNWNVTPYALINKFKEVVECIKDKIKSKAKDFTPDKAYYISMISTNGNEEVSDNIRNIYEEYGVDVDITLGISNTKDSQIKIYDGLMITEGFSDPAWINNAVDNVADIRNAHIYYFKDPINTMDMIGYFESILAHNIYDPIENDEDMIPTVICCPQLSRDLSSSLKRLATLMYQYDNRGAQSAKPPVLIITDIVASDEHIMSDIADLCGCRAITKYIDPERYHKDVEAGIAPTMDNVFEFYGTAEQVISDSKKTKFINPPHAKEDDPIYVALVNFLETEIKNNIATNNANENGNLKKRLSALKANMVEYLVGGVTVSDRDAAKDLIEDAIKNCHSASMYGVGYAANYEALCASISAIDEFEDNDIRYDIAHSIFSAYYDIEKILYSTVESNEDIVEETIGKSIEDYNGPCNIGSGTILSPDYSNPVYCSIMLDVNILDTLSKIITMMVTCNQCLLQAPNLNSY